MQNIIKYRRSFAKILFFLFLLFSVQTLLSISFVYRSSIGDLAKSLNNLSSRIENDLKYKNGKWDMDLYNADPLTPYPNGSSGFTNPLYIIANNGFIIERSQPINGLLDTSDFKHLMQFQTPQTIDGSTNEKWRIVSKPIISRGKTVGVIAVSYYNPRDVYFESIDRKLSDSIISIESALMVRNGAISANKLDIRNIHYEFSFEVVDVYNNVIVNNGRVPTFVDVSYFSKELQEKRSRIVVDMRTKDPYYIVSRSIKNNSGEVVGVIVAGESISKIYKALQNYILFSFVLIMSLAIPLIMYMSVVLKKDILFLLVLDQDVEKITIKKIQFNKKTSTIFFDTTLFSIPYASNQYYICDALFSHPTKKWEYDELLEKIGDFSNESINTRKVYDAVLAINKKVGIRLIEYKHKVFFLNVEVLPFLSKV